jgi:hypothetical protein
MLLQKIVSHAQFLNYHLIEILNVFRCDSAALYGFVLMFLASIMWLKLVSYAHTNYDIRVLSKSIEKVTSQHVLPAKLDFSGSKCMLVNHELLILDTILFNFFSCQ